MYINNRDQVNYHEFLKNARTKCGVSQLEVSRGLYTSSSYNRAELGVRVPEKLMRDRLTSRMGISGERYVEYLCLVELQQWKLRKNLVKAIAEKDAERAKSVLTELENIMDKDNKVQVQFINSMRFSLLQLENASNEDLFASVDLAVACTVEHIDEALAGKHLLSGQELDLIAERMRLMPCTETANETTWRILEFQKLITYMDNSFMENLEKVKVYPKVTCFICELLLKEETALYKLRDAWKLCDIALTLLTDMHRLYYFVELLEYKKEIFYRMMNYGIDEEEENEIHQNLVNTLEQEKLWKNYYDEYGISYYTENSLYLYWETECQSAVEVLEARRKMMRIPRAILCEGICTERSLIRIERTNYSPSMFVLNGLFERMGLCAEYRRGQLVTNNVDLLETYRKLTNAANVYCEKDCDTYVEELKKGLSMDISFNRQEMERIEAICADKKGCLSEEEMHEKIVDALECTLPTWALYNHKGSCGTYFTRSELACISDLAFMVHGEHSERCVEIIKTYCEENMQGEIEPAKLGIVEFLANGLAAYLISIGEEDKAKTLQWELMKVCFSYKRMPFSLVHDKETQVMWIE